MEMDKRKGESAVEIKKKASKQTKEEAPLERAKSITSSNATKTSEQTEKKKEDLLSFNNIKVYIVKMAALCSLKRYDGLMDIVYLMLNLLQDERKKERLRPMERRMREEEWEIEQEKNFELKQGAENRRPAIEKEKNRYDTDELFTSFYLKLIQYVLNKGLQLFKAYFTTAPKIKKKKYTHDDPCALLAIPVVFIWIVLTINFFHYINE